MATIMVEQAAIRTAKVEIKALTVGGKQVTMGLFRQLKNETLIDPETLQRAGEPWGVVNYFWGNCSDNHLHIVWQSGDELRRSCVYPRLHEPWAGYAHNEYQYPKSVLVDKLWDNLQWNAERWLVSQALKGDSIKGNREGHQEWSQFKVAFGDLVIPVRFRDKVTHGAMCFWVDRGIDGEKREHMEQFYKIGSSDPWDVLRYYYEEMITHMRKYKQQYAELKSLDQLFIAV